MDYFKKIKEIIIDKTGVEAEEITLDSFFEDDLNIGEIELMEILTELEDIFKVDLHSKKDDLETIHDLVDALVEELE